METATPTPTTSNPGTITLAGAERTLPPVGMLKFNRLATVLGEISRANPRTTLQALDLGMGEDSDPIQALAFYILQTSPDMVAQQMRLGALFLEDNQTLKQHLKAGTLDAHLDEVAADLEADVTPEEWEAYMRLLWGLAIRPTLAKTALGQLILRGVDAVAATTAKASEPSEPPANPSS